MAGPVGNLISNRCSAPKRSVRLRGGHGCGPGGWGAPSEPSSLGTVPQTVWLSQPDCSSCYLLTVTFLLGRY